MPEKRSIKNSPIKIIILYSFITAFILIAGIRYYLKQQIEIKNDIYQDLSIISELKVNQIVNWRKERFGDAMVIFSNKNFIEEVSKEIKNNGKNKSDEKVRQFLGSYINFYHYKDIILFDSRYKIILSLVSDKESLGKNTRLNIDSAVKKNYPEFSNIYFCELCREIHLDVIVPLILNNETIGGIILRIDPDEFLYPLIQTWPTNSYSAETVMTSVIGDSVYYLNELRHKKGTALNLKYKVDSANTSLPSIKAVLGKTGMYEGIDYRGVPVLSDIKKIPGSPWFLLAKVDIEEIYAPVREKAVIISILTGLVLLSVGIGFIWVWSNQKKSLRILQLEDDYSRQALVKHFEYVVKYANDIFLLTDKNLKIVEANDTTFAVYGYTREEMIGMKIEQLRNPADLNRLRQQLELLKDADSAIYEAEHKKKDGTIFPVEVSLRVVKINERDYYQAILKDITEKKENERIIKESEEQYRSLFENMLEGFALCQMIFDGDYPVDFRYLKVNDAFAKLTGLNNVEGKLVSEIIPGIRTSDDKLFEIYGKVALTGNTEKFEMYVEALKDWYDISVYSPKKSFFVAVFDVITKRKVTEEKLRENELKFRSLFENSILGIYRTTPEGEILECNSALLKLLGFEKFEELAERNLEQYGYEPGFSRNKFKKLIQEKGEVLGFESSWIKKDGNAIVVRENAKAVKNSDGKIICYEGTVEDITEKKKIEIELKQSEIKYRRLHESMIDGYAFVNMNGLIVECNEAYKDMLGYTFDELTKMTYKDLTPEKWHEFETTIIRNQITERGYSDVYEKEYIRKNGEVFPVEIRSFLIRNEKGEAEGMWGIIRDITERKKIDDVLKESEEKFRNVFENSIVGKSITGLDGTLKVNKAFCEMLGYSKEELINANFREITHPDDIKYTDKIIESMIDGSMDSARFEKRYIHKNGNIIWTDVSTVLQKDKSGKPLFFITAILDLTERKKADEALMENEAKFHSLFESMSEGVALHEIIFDQNGDAVDYKILDVNPAFGRHTGIDTENCKNKIASEFYGVKPIPPYFDIYKNVALTGQPVSYETFFPPLKKYFEISVFSPKKNFFATVFSDTTERKLAEEKIRESERKLREAQDLAHLGYWKWNVKTGEVEWSDEVYRIFRLDKDKFTPHIDSILALSPWPEENNRDKELIQRAVETRTPGFYEQKFLRPDNSIGYYSSTFHGNYDDNDHLISIVGTIIDITERKKAEIALQESEFFFRESQKAASIGSYKQSLKSMIWESSEILDEIFGIDKNYVRDVNGWLNLVYPEDRKMMTDYYNDEIMSKHIPFNKEYRILRKSDGKVRWVLGLGKIIFDEDNNPDTMIGTIQDITERKEIQLQINRLNEELEQRVIERTKELEEKNTELNRMNRLFVGRELRMVELKDKIKELEIKLKELNR